MEFNENDLEFVARNYRSDKFDTRKALRRFHAETDSPVHRRWWMTAAAAAASVSPQPRFSRPFSNISRAFS